MFHRRRKHNDFAAEIESHLALEADRLQASGMSPADAAAQARKQFGNATLARETFYHAAHSMWWDHLRHDLLFAIRNLRKSPGFTAAAILTLALGIGANTALFSVIDHVLIRPLPYPDAHRLVMLYGQLPNGEREGPSPADFLDYQRQSHSFAALAGFREMPFNLTGGDRPERIEGSVVTPEFFRVFQTPAQLGRTVLPDVDPPGARVVVLSDALWRTKFNADPRLVGQSIQINGEPRTVLGIMPPAFQFPLGSQLWTVSRYAVIEQPLAPQIDQSNVRDAHYFETVGRLRPDHSLAQASAEANAVAKRLKHQFGETEEATSSAVTELQADLTGDTRPTLLLLLGGVAILLLVACVNVANLLLARGASRARELALRTALGASRARIIKQLLVESLLLAVAGGVLGIGVAYCTRVPLTLFMPPELLLGVTPTIDARILAFTLALSVISGILFGIVPALHGSALDLHSTLKEGARGSTHGAGTGSAQSALLISEVAFATVLLIAAGLLLRSFLALLSAPQGFHAENVLSAELSFSPVRYPLPAERSAFVDRALNRIRALPGVTAAGLASRLPLNRGNSTRDIAVQGSPRFPADIMDVDYFSVSPDFFQTLRIPVIRGRAFTAADTPQTAPVVVVNEAAAHLLWPQRDALTGLVTVGACGNANQLCRVVGVVGNIRQHNLAEPPRPAVYVPYARDPWPFFAFVIHTRTSPLNTAHAVEKLIAQLDPDQPLFHIRAMNDVVSGSLAARRFRMLLLALFAALALLLGAVGVYGVVAYAVAQRSVEIGIRMALGANPRSVRRLVIRSGLQKVLAGALLGGLLSLAVTRLLASTLYGVPRTDPITLLATLLVLIAVAFLATYIPALRATRINPVEALRAE